MISSRAETRTQNALLPTPYSFLQEIFGEHFVSSGHCRLKDEREPLADKELIV